MNVYLKALLLCATAGLFQSLPWYASAALLALLALLAFGFYNAGDPYGSFHIAFNITDPEQGDHPPTEWLNMGYWKVRRVSSAPPNAMLTSTISTRPLSQTLAKVCLRFTLLASPANSYIIIALALKVVQAAGCVPGGRVLGTFRVCSPSLRSNPTCAPLSQMWDTGAEIRSCCSCNIRRYLVRPNS